MVVTIDQFAGSGRSLLCSWRNMLAIVHAVLIFLSLWYCKLVYWNASEVCYVDPCYEGPGLEELWKVNKGVSFTGASSGIFALAHAVLGYVLFARISSEESSSLLEHAHFVVGIFAGATLCASLLSLNMVYVWGAETNLMINLSKLKESNSIFEESDRHMLVVHSLIGTFLRLSTLSSALCFFQLVVLVQLLSARKEFTRYFRLLATGEFDRSSETIPLRSMSTTPTDGTRSFSDQSNSQSTLMV
ncbi:unnamed protein product [Pseudo-nitzschia multistriata]|uniref:Uncharacterized protein n=1 Tax=Pseudo-nitzschia multistriata TaxID=183589 RepID=A0A448ZK64_9STRA|nr:unnamed protein product [Pseudo-nitzschia multistriata]